MSFTYVIYTTSSTYESGYELVYLNCSDNNIILTIPSSIGEYIHIKRIDNNIANTCTIIPEEIGVKIDLQDSLSMNPIEAIRLYIAEDGEYWTL